MPRDQVPKDPAHRPHPLHRIDRPCSRMVNLAWPSFISFASLKSTAVADVVLEISLVLAKIVPQPRDLTPIGISERVCELGGEPPHISQVIFQGMGNTRSLSIEPNMSNRGRVHGRGLRAPEDRPSTINPFFNSAPLSKNDSKPSNITISSKRYESRTKRSASQQAPPALVSGTQGAYHGVSIQSADMASRLLPP